jgi:hypothetical protein
MTERLFLGPKTGENALYEKLAITGNNSMKSGKASSGKTQGKSI